MVNYSQLFIIIQVGNYWQEAGLTNLLTCQSR